MSKEKERSEAGAKAPLDGSQRLVGAEQELDYENVNLRKEARAIALQKQELAMQEAQQRVPDQQEESQGIQGKPLGNQEGTPSKDMNPSLEENSLSAPRENGVTDSARARRKTPIADVSTARPRAGGAGVTDDIVAGADAKANAQPEQDKEGAVVHDTIAPGVPNVFVLTEDEPEAEVNTQPKLYDHRPSKKEEEAVERRQRW